MHGTFTAPRVNWSGSSLRTEATGYGLVTEFQLNPLCSFAALLFTLPRAGGTRDAFQGIIQLISKRALAETIQKLTLARTTTTKQSFGVKVVTWHFPVPPGMRMATLERMQ